MSGKKAKFFIAEEKKQGMKDALAWAFQNRSTVIVLFAGVMDLKAGKVVILFYRDKPQIF